MTSAQGYTCLKKLSNRFEVIGQYRLQSFPELPTLLSYLQQCNYASPLLSSSKPSNSYLLNHLSLRSEYHQSSFSRLCWVDVVGVAIIIASPTMLNLKARIINHEIGEKEKVVYQLEVTNEQTGQAKTNKLRYSEFKNIHEELQKLVDRLKLHIILPQFPSRKLFGSTNKSEESIFERKKDLNTYLNDLLSNDKLHGLDLIKKHFMPSEQAQPAEKKEAEEINIQICIDRYTLVEDVVIYYVRLRDLNSHEEWTFKSRYSELSKVHEALEESNIKNLPPFPKKKIFGITNENPQNIERRRGELEKYFNEIFNSREVLTSPVIRYFIEESKKQANRDKELEALRKKKSDKQ